MNEIDTRTVVIETMNILQFEYDIEGLENLGNPTVDEIVARIIEQEGNDQ